MGADVGTGWNILSIPAAAFAPQNSSWSYVSDAIGYVYPTGGASTFYVHAAVTLPSGAEIGFLNLTRTTATGNVGPTYIASLRRLTGYGTVCSPTLSAFPPVLRHRHCDGPHDSRRGYTYRVRDVSPPHIGR